MFKGRYSIGPLEAEMLQVMNMLPWIGRVGL